MRITYIVKYIAQLGGLDRVLTFKMNWLATHGHEVSLITYEQQGHDFSFALDGSIRHEDINVKLWKKQGSNVVRRTLSYLQLRRQFRRRMTEAVGRMNPDVLVTLTDSYQVLDILLSIPTHAVRIVESHVERSAFMKVNDFRGRHLLQAFARLYDRHLAHSIRTADALVLLTRQDAGQWAEMARRVVIPNPLTVQPSRFSDATTHRVIAAGRLEAQKGFDLLVEAWSRVHAAASDWQLHIYGNGPDREALQRQIDQVGLTDSVTLYPATPDIFDRYAESSIYVLSSRYEGYGLVLAEAMSCGVPCVSFNCPYGPADIIRNGEDGILVPNGDVQALADGLLTYIRDVARRQHDGQLARQNIQRFSADYIMGQWELLFKTLRKQ